jgi:UDP-N-acetylglucosamine transferase subunit ALG13
MIFVTVGTHEQPFNRLVKHMDFLSEKGTFREEIYILTGYSTFSPEYCSHTKFLKFDSMVDKMEKARIIITHGGASSIILAFNSGKIPIVVPRQKKHHEHVDDHQVYFCRKLEQKGEIIAIYDVEDLENRLLQYDEEVSKLRKTNPRNQISGTNSTAFTRELEKICSSLVKKK